MKYRKKPVVIEAWQFGSDEQRPEWLYDAFDNGTIRMSVNCDKLYVKTLKGTHTAKQGDYIIQGVQGELYPCKPDIFRKTYEPEENVDGFNTYEELSSRMDFLRF